MIATRIATLQTRLDVLSEEYDRAETHLTTLRHDVTSDTRLRDSAKAIVARDRKALLRQAVDAYVDDGDASTLTVVLSTKTNSLPTKQTYLQVAAETLSASVNAVRESQHTLVERTTRLAHAENDAEATLHSIDAARSDATGLQDQYAATLRGVKGEEAQLVAAAQHEAAVRAAAKAAAAEAAKQAASQSAPVVASGSPPAPAPTGSDSAGNAAVRAAETQLGVPYVWGGSTPGVGFDCSGLTMWAWGRAGVGLPHSAAEQYADIEHVPMTDLEPGDLIFYASGGYIYHVIMYIGGGRAIQAMDTGTVISITPVWPGAYGAGRP